MKLTRQEFEQLRRRVGALEAVLTPELRREADLIRKAEFVVDVAKAEGMLPSAPTNIMPKKFREHWEGRDESEA